MGHRLVADAFAFVSAFNERARQDGDRQLEPLELAVLVLMAHTCPDGDEHPHYFASRETTVAALGITNTDAGRKRVQRALRALIDAGAINPPETIYRGHTPRYRLIYQGGALASTFAEERGTREHHLSPGRWTPDARKVDVSDRKVDVSDPEGGALASTGRERREQEKEDAREHAFELQPPPIPEPEDHTPPPPRIPTQCDRHQDGPHTSPCHACGVARREYEQTERATTRRRRHTITHRTVDGRRICDNRPHVRTADGSCVNCEIRAEDLTPLGASA